ncbi:hypothetical protein PNOK_0612400 [Pyrrhoderma noxium]|uniref:Uncharacterized protein n=1 Tax=Pyrrhoderma noxium TaxID=2282107 RepID=A0A286UDM0_9AGAM|nr:hypothetical protein PNOK_0612400 [Pyrrhoderma noxium]
MDGSGWTIPQNMPKSEDETPGPSSDTYDPMIVGQQESIIHSNIPFNTERGHTHQSIPEERSQEAGGHLLYTNMTYNNSTNPPNFVHAPQPIDFPQGGDYTILQDRSLLYWGNYPSFSTGQTSQYTMIGGQSTLSNLPPKLPEFIEGLHGAIFPVIPCPEGLFPEQISTSNYLNLNFGTHTKPAEVHPVEVHPTEASFDQNQPSMSGRFIHMPLQVQTGALGEASHDNFGQADMMQSPSPASTVEILINESGTIICPFDSTLIPATNDAISAHKVLCSDPDVQSIPREPRTHRRGLERIQDINKSQSVSLPIFGFLFHFDSSVVELLYIGTYRNPDTQMPLSIIPKVILIL